MERLMELRKRKRRLKIIAMYSSSVAAVLVLFFVISYIYLEKADETSSKKISNKEIVGIEPNVITGKKESSSGLQDSIIDRKSVDATSSTTPLVTNDHSIAKRKETIKLNNTLDDFNTKAVALKSYRREFIPIYVPINLDSVTSIDEKLAINDQIPPLKSDPTTRDEGLGQIEDLSVSKTKNRVLGTLSVLAAPDLTSVHGANQSSLSQNIGILYTQNLGKKLSISTGILYAKKYYNAPSSLYNPKNPIIGNYASTNINAVCDVVDVPLLLNYQLYERRNFTLNIGAGFSNYFMLKEDYTFSQAEGNTYGIAPKYSYTLRNQNNHWFGVADFSVSIDHRINNRLSIGLRPFMKVPLTGIGYGRVRLESKGVAVTVGYHLFK